MIKISLKKILFIFFLALFFNSFLVKSQDKTAFKFFHLVPEDFDLSKNKIDTSFGAVIIADIGNTSFEGNVKGWFSLIYKHTRRVKIFNKKGYDLASVEIPLYKSNSENTEKTQSIKASTYELINGKVLETKLNKDAIFNEKLDRNHNTVKFTLPNIKDGCIIEYTYTVNSDFLFNLQPWVFQGSYPRLWSEYVVDFPSFFTYSTIAQGYVPFSINTTRNYNVDYRVTQNSTYNLTQTENIVVPSSNTEHRWVMENIPALKEEKFTSSIKNHIAKIEFQLAGEQFPNQPYKNLASNWEILSEKLLNQDDFGDALNRDNSWMETDMKTLRTQNNSKEEQARKIYDFIKRNIKWKGTNSFILSQTQKDCFKSKSGNTADINLLLVAMLRHEKIEAVPVILSTRSNGFINPFYPLLDRFNYVICKVDLDGKSLFLDASKPYLGFGKLPYFCYNGPAKSIEKTPATYDLYPDSIKETQLTNVILSSEKNKPGSWIGRLNQTFGDYESDNIRDQILEKGEEDYLKKVKSANAGFYTIDSVQLEEEKNLESPLKISYKLKLESGDNPGLIYFNPLLGNAIKENPFTATERKYPVEMPYKTDVIYSFVLEIPKGYKIDELPKSAKVNLNQNEGFFEYLIGNDENSIFLRTRIRFNKAVFLPEDYETLRNFYSMIIKKHAEQIVLKKI